VNKQHFLYLAPHNPQELHQCSLHSLKVTMWCTISSCGIIHPYSFEDGMEHGVTASTEWYEVMLE
jgi:hypothetical protein